VTSDAESDPYRAQAAAMVELQLRRRGIRDERVLAAMERVPRHEFVPAALAADAYSDSPVPIGDGQTISQPYIVAAMLEALALRPTDRALEVGTGSGYVTAILAELTAAVFSIERYRSLAFTAHARLARLGYRNVGVFIGDGTEGLPEHAPYDAIMVSAAAPRVPPPLFDQLAEGGRLIIPVGTPIGQDLELVRKIGGSADIVRLDGCRFVPLIGREGFGNGWSIE
jgi:protein-L-isoaspartate(D-aspartate) O-methyltransferase